MKPILGIDLGTTKCVACVCLGNEFVEIPPVSGRFGGMTILPSVFFQPSSGGPVVGEDALSEAGFDPQFRGQVIRNVKRSMKHNFPEGIKPAKKFRSGNRDFTPAEISSHFLRVLREAAQRETDRLKARPSASGLAWNNWLDEVVITVPAYFSPVERRATREAARLAGFPEAGVHLLDEPVAAALSERIHEQTQQARILVVDLGGGTCDLTLLETGAGGFRELGRFGDNDFGGLEWDLEIAELALRKHPLPSVRHLYGPDGTPDYCRFAHLFAESEEAKKRFGAPESRRFTEFTVQVANPDRPQLDSLGEPVPIGRKEFDELSHRLAEYCGHLADRLIESIKPSELNHKQKQAATWADVDTVLLVGGGSQLGAVRETLQRRLKKPPTIPAGAQLAIARGAAMYGQILSRGINLEGISHPRCPLDFGIMVTPKPEGIMSKVLGRIFGRGAKLPRQNGSAEHLPALKFRALIDRNTQLPFDYRAQFPLDSSDSERMLLEVCFRQYTRQKPSGFIRRLHLLEFGFQRSANPARDRLVVSMRFDENYKLHVTAQCGGKSVTIKKDMDDLEGGERV